MRKKSDLTEALDHIPPDSLNYQEWVNVGMALKHEGYSVSDWDLWSQNDKRYRKGECFKKWSTFDETKDSLITGGTVMQYAKERGWSPVSPDITADTALDWDDEIGDAEEAAGSFFEPERWNPADQIAGYIEALFESTEYVGYVTETWEKEDGKHIPQKGYCDRTAGELLEALKEYGGDISKAFGNFNPEAGAWIRINPLDGKGVKNENVTDFRHALVESDELPVPEQIRLIKKLELPVAVMVYSGGKSVHAVVRIEAANQSEYRSRVEYLYNVCESHGLKVDRQNKNPSRLSRMPGVTRNGHKQFIISKNTGRRNFNEWKEWIESVSDDLPDPESLADVWNSMPELSPPLIEGVLRKGHKMLLAGPSKAGKSFALIELCIAVAGGMKWLKWQCAKGRVLYVNLELDRASCLHRFHDVCLTMNAGTDVLSNIDIWNLRGKSLPLDKLAPKLIRRAQSKNYSAVIIDPIYKVITGDENSADQMAAFCNQFDKICSELGTAVIYCHHHSKGQQGAKRSMDRASGSGVFARDPDALLDLIELDISGYSKAETFLKNRAAVNCCMDYIRKKHPELEKQITKEMMKSRDGLTEFARQMMPREWKDELEEMVSIACGRAMEQTAWRIDATLREFPKFPPVNLFFEYPVHYLDEYGVLEKIIPDDPKRFGQRENLSKRKSKAENQKDREDALSRAYNNLPGDEDGGVDVKEVSQYIDREEKSARRWILNSEKFKLVKGKMYPAEAEKNGQN